MKYPTGAIVAILSIIALDAALWIVSRRRNRRIARDQRAKRIQETIEWKT